MRRWVGPLLLVLVLGTALFLGARDGDGPPTAAQRTAAIAERVRCPTCGGLSVADSDAAASEEIRREIRRRVDAGESDEEIVAFLVDRFGRDILLTPPRSGVGAVVWALPVAAVAAAALGLAVAFRRWRPRGPVEVSAEDRALVERALRR